MIRIDPIAIPIEKTAMNKLATRSSAPNTFFTSGGKMMISTAPMVQKKLIEQMARKSRRMCMVAFNERDRCPDDVTVEQNALSGRRGRRHLATGEETDGGNADRNASGDTAELPRACPRESSRGESPNTCRLPPGPFHRALRLCADVAGGWRI